MKKRFILLLLALVMFSGCATGDRSDAVGLSGMIVAESELFYDFGAIDIEGGLVDHTFSFTNEGQEDLVIMNLATSCGCTSAEVILSDGTESPTFGMHDSTEWNHAIAPGESFDVLVIYDPMAHGPNATGEMNRSVMMVTSSQENGRTAVLDPSTGYAFTQINIRGMVLSSDDYVEFNSSQDEV